MTWMLASVRDLDEARVALAAGADVIDLKDPARGALGAVPLQSVVECVADVGGRCLTSAALGEATSEPQALAAALAKLSATGVDMVKIGFREPHRQDICIDALAAGGRGCALIAVLFADAGYELHCIERFALAGVRGVMLDTAYKTDGGLRRWVSDSELRAFAAAARAHRLWCGFAGSLGHEDVPTLLSVGPDVLGFRGALCLAGERLAPVDRGACRTIREAIPARSWRRPVPIRSGDCPSASAAWSGVDPW